MFRPTYFSRTDLAVTLVTAGEEVPLVALSWMLMMLVAVTAAPAALLVANIACFLGGVVAGCQLASRYKK